MPIELSNLDNCQGSGCKTSQKVSLYYYVGYTLFCMIIMILRNNRIAGISSIKTIIHLTYLPLLFSVL